MLQNLHHPKVNTWLEHPEFLESELVELLAEEPLWTVSDKNKRPINIGLLEDQAEIAGAPPTDPFATTTLTHLQEVLPDAANAAFRLDSEIHNICVLDIEPACPEDEIKPMMRFPYIWAERSMSGKGIHLVLPVPAATMTNEYARTRAAIRDPEGKYEILLSHWVTFTRNAIYPTQNPDGDISAWEAFAEELVAKAPHPKVLVDSSTLDLSDIRPKSLPSEKKILSVVLSTVYSKRPSDFNFDMSRYEFGYMNFMYRHILNVLKRLGLEKAYDEEARAWLLFDLCEVGLEHRDKHDEKRLGLPYLLYRAKVVIATHEAEELERQKNAGA